MEIPVSSTGAILACLRRPALDFGPAFQCPKKRYFIYVFQIPPNGNPAGNPGNLDSGGLNQLADIHCCCLTFQAGIGCNDDFFNIGLKPLHQFLEFNIIWANSQHRGDGSVKYMVDTIILAGLLISSQIPGILNHHDGLVVSPVAAADWAQFLIRKGKALLAVAHIIPGPGHGSGQFLHLLLGHVDDMKCQALGRFGANSRKLGQLFY